MRKIYKDPKELATCLKDLIDFYLDDVMPYDKLKTKITILLNANEDRVYKDGFLSLKISNTLGETRVDVLNKVAAEIQS